MALRGHRVGQRVAVAAGPVRRERLTRSKRRPGDRPARHPSLRHNFVTLSLSEPRGRFCYTSNGRDNEKSAAPGWRRRFFFCLRRSLPSRRDRRFCFVRPPCPVNSGSLAASPGAPASPRRGLRSQAPRRRFAPRSTGAGARTKSPLSSSSRSRAPASQPPLLPGVSDFNHGSGFS